MSDPCDQGYDHLQIDVDMRNLDRARNLLYWILDYVDYDKKGLIVRDKIKAYFEENRCGSQS